MKKRIKVFNIQLDPSQSNLIGELGKKLSSAQMSAQFAALDKQFREQCKNAGIVGSCKVSVRIEIYEDKTFKLNINRHINTSELIKQSLNLVKGAKSTGHGEPIALITEDQLNAIAQKKMLDMGTSLESAKKSVIGTAKSMGIILAK